MCTHSLDTHVCFTIFFFFNNFHLLSKIWYFRGGHPVIHLQFPQSRIVLLPEMQRFLFLRWQTTYYSLFKSSSNISSLGSLFPQSLIRCIFLSSRLRKREQLSYSSTVLPVITYLHKIDLQTLQGRVQLLSPQFLFGGWPTVRNLITGCKNE